MPDAYFGCAQLSGGTDSATARYRASTATTGPWDPRLQHGGPPSALLVLLAERLAATRTERTDLVAVRYAAEFVGPVPVGDLDVAARVVRVARSGVLVALSLTAQERLCLEARVWLIRDADTTAVALPAQDMPVPAHAPGLGGSFPYADSIEWRAERGSLAEPGPGTMWTRPRIPVLDDEPVTGLQHAVLVGDSASGVSAELDWGVWTFLNVDLDVHLARPVQGSWLRMDATTQLGTHGSGLARSVLSDVAGPVGATAQTLVLSPRALSTR